MKLRIQYMYENGNDSYMTMLTEAKDFTDFLNKAENIMQLTKYDRKMLDLYKETQQEIEDKEAGVKKEQEALEELKQEVWTSRRRYPTGEKYNQADRYI